MPGPCRDCGAMPWRELHRPGCPATAPATAPDALTVVEDGIRRLEEARDRLRRHGDARDAAAELRGTALALLQMESRLWPVITRPLIVIRESESIR